MPLGISNKTGLLFGSPMIFFDTNYLPIKVRKPKIIISERPIMFTNINLEFEIICKIGAKFDRYAQSSSALAVHSSMS